MPSPIFTKTGAVGSPLTLEKARFLPANEPRDPNIRSGEAGGGQIKTALVGTTKRFWRIIINRISKTNRDAIISFFEDSNVNWELNTFLFTDENSTDYTVRIWNSKKIDFPRVKGGLYNINILLRQEIL